MGIYDNYSEKDAKIAGTIGMIFFLVLFLIFLVLKLTVIITWSWWFILAPIWVPMILGWIMMLCGIKPPGQ